MPIAIDKAGIVALVVECCFFGIFTTFFCVTLWVLFNKSSTGRASRFLVLTVCSLYILAVTHLSIDVCRAVQAFVGYADIPHGSIVFYGKLNEPTEIVKTAVYASETVLADSFFVWRCYVVWDKRWPIIVLPITMVIGTASSAAGLCWAFSKAAPGNVVFESVLAPWVASAWSTTLATNVTCTVLISFRIWRGQRRLKQAGMSSTLLPVMIIVIESGAIYSSGLISALAAYASGNNSQYIIRDFLPSLIGIVFTTIIIRVALGISSNGGSPQLPKARAIPNFLKAPDRSSSFFMKSMASPTSICVEKHYHVEQGY